MPTNDFLAVAAASSGANVDSQAVFAANASLLSTGFTSGIVPSSVINKILRQSSAVAAMAAAFMAAQGYDARDDGNAANLLANFQAALQKLQRIKLTGNLTLYVSISGSDANNGLTSGAPFQTIQAAVNAVYNLYDLNAHQVTISVAAGTYAHGAGLYGIPVGASNIAGAPVWIIGAGTGSTFVSVSGVDEFCFYGNSAYFRISGFTLIASNGVCIGAGQSSYIEVQSLTMQASGVSVIFHTRGCAITCWIGSVVVFVGGGLNFGACSNTHILTNSWVGTAGAGYSISGGAQNHILAGAGGQATISGVAVTINNAVSFSSAFATAVEGGLIAASVVTFVNPGNVSGKRYEADNYGVVDTAFGGPNYLPGTIAGATSNGTYI